MNTLVAWTGILPSLFVAFALLVLPGAVLGALLRQRGLRLLVLAPALSVSLIVVASLVAPFVGIPWSILPVLLLTLVAAVAAWAWARWAGTPASAGWGRWRIDPVLVAAVAIPAILISFILVRSMGDPAWFAQRYDNFFHLNGIQYVIDTGNASPLWLGGMTSPGNLLFYPSGWHAVVSLVVMLSGAAPAVASNAVVIAVAAVVWPLGAVFLARTILGRSRLVTIGAGAVAAGFPAFPFLPLHYGTLYPLFLGLALVPTGLALLWQALRPGDPARSVRAPRRQDLILLLVLVAPGIAVAHPGAMMGLIALGAAFLVVRLTYELRVARTARARLVVLGIAAGAAVAGIVLLRFIRPPSSQIYWPAIETIPHAIGEVFSASVYLYPIAWVVAAFLLVGAYAAVRRGGYVRWSVLLMAVVGSVLYVVVAGSSSQTLRIWLTGPWYNNAPRLASIWAIAVLPLVALGVVATVRAVLRLRVFAPVRRALPRVSALLVVILGVLVALGTQGAAIRQSAADIEYTHREREGGPILSLDEIALIQELPELLPEDAVLAGDPWTGASFAYGMVGIPVLMPHLLMDITDDMREINTRLATEGDDPAVCAAVERTGADYVLDFSADGDFMDNDGEFEGLDDLEDSPFVELIAEEGEARLYQIVSCGEKP